MHLYKVLNQPSVARLSLPITIDSEEALIVVRGTDLLQLYKFISVTVDVVKESGSGKSEIDDQAFDPAGDSFIGTEVTLQTSTEETTTRFVQVGEWHLDGYVTDLHTFKLPGYKSDCLAIAFKHAKLVLMAWESELLLWNPLSIHYYEKELLTAHFFDKEFESYFSVDPQTSCLCFVYQANNVAILPFHTDESLGDDVAMTNGSGDSAPPIFQPSFLISAKQLDESISHITKLAFLPEYREPTLAIIFQPIQTWTGLLPKHKDTMRYLVLSLDVQQKSSVVLASVTGLPHDLHQIYPLPTPIGGCVLVGANHIFHIDSAGNANGLGVNKYASLVSDKPAVDQSDLNIHLEGSKVVTLDPLTGDLLLILEDGSFFLIGFKVEGRKVFGLKLTQLCKGDIFCPRPLTATNFSSRSLFIGSKADDAKLIKWKHKGEVMADEEETKKVAVLTEAQEEQINDENYDELDEIYGDDDGTSTKKSSASKSTNRGDISELEFAINDILPNYGPINSLTLSWPNPYRSNATLEFGDPQMECYDIVAATGAEISGGLSIFNQSIRPSIVADLLLEGSKKLWTLAPQNQAAGGTNVLGEDISAYDSYLVSSGTDSTALYKVNDALEEITMESDFVAEGQTLVAGTLLEGSIVVQVHSSGIAYYDSELNKVKEIELDDTVISAELCDPFVLLHLQNGSYIIYTASHNAKSGLPVLDKHKYISDTPHSITFATLVSSTLLAESLKKGTKRKRAANGKEHEETVGSTSKHPSPLLLLVHDDTLQIISLSDTKVRLEIKGLELVPSTLVSSAKKTTKSKTVNGTAPHISADTQAIPPDQLPHIRQVKIAKIGDSIHKEDYLVVLSDSYDLVLYRIIMNEDNSSMRLVKCQYHPASAVVKDAAETGIKPEIILFDDITEYSGVVVTGSWPLMITKTAQSPPRLHRFTNSLVLGFTPFHTESVYKGFVYIANDNIVRVANLDIEFDLGNSLPAKQIKLGGTLMGMCYHEATNTYVIAVAEPQPYDAVDEDGTTLTGVDEELPKADTFRGKIKLVSPMTWTVIDEFELEENELIMCIKSLVLEVENSKEKREVVVFGSSYLRGEDLAAKGNYYVYDVVDVVPEPGRPETNHKLKEVVKEGVKAAATAVSAVDGYLLVAQGQKIVLRSLAEDNTIIPVAFIDVNTYVIDAKCAKNMVLLADTLKSVWLVGFGEEPYRMTLLGKDYTDLEVISSDFVVENGNLFIVVADSSKKLHLLQYDPEDPLSLQGQKLVRRSEFFTGKVSRAMILVPVNILDNDGPTNFMPLIGSDDGSIAYVSPLSESAYRTLFAIQQQVTEKDMHNACLNPRMHRATMSSTAGVVTGAGGRVSRQMIDYAVIGRFSALSAGKKYVYSRRLGKHSLKEVWKCLADIEKQLNYI